jgi:protein tyrosine phosphatase (PTP) superfamily phosphohydrolase (DUF442 family)
LVGAIAMLRDTQKMGVGARLWFSAGIGLLVVLALGGCATQDSSAARMPSGGNDCFWAGSIHDWKALSDQRLIVWSPSRQCAYQVDLAHRCNGPRFTNDIGFQDRDGRICSFGGDAIVIPGPTGDHCSIASIKRLAAAELDLLLSAGAVSKGNVGADAGDCVVEPKVERETPAVSAADIGAAEAWGGASNVVSVKHLYFSEQPDAATLIEARDRGVGVVINLREPSELDWDEARAATDSGLTYYNVPIAAAGSSFDAATMEEISMLVQKHQDQKILLHCSSGNRASAWLAIHLVNDHGMGVEPSISLARKIGLTKPVIEARVREYLNEVEQSPPRSE